jgi:hypothetical protein
MSELRTHDGGTDSGGARRSHGAQSASDQRDA